MPKMTRRWHAANCASPTVKLSEDNWPYCTSCGKTCPPLEQLIASNNTSHGNSAVQIPPDEPQGQMNLHWPKGVRYVRTESELSVKSGDGFSTSKSREPTFSQSWRLSHIYNESLNDEQFRIAYLLPPSHEDSPVHITLETFRLDSHPEYETTSYLWGGEDGCYSQCCPIFIGSFWDVLLQTHNCWSMLKFMRPSRGERLMWIDAVCINQHNNEEKAVQVAMMRKIYRMCTRVVVYLGEDIVSKTTPFPHYRTLDEIEAGNLSKLVFPKSHQMYNTSFHLAELLQRRYFTRIWIIQELILPEKIVFRIGDTDFRADAKTMAQLDAAQRGSGGHRNITAASWFQCLAQGSLNDAEIGDEYALLRSAHKSEASDPRDKLFGTITLLPNHEILKSFQPDYSISYLHYCIGIVAHWILNRTVSHLLHKARTLARSSACDSLTWLPDFGSPDAWEKIFDSTTYQYRGKRDNLLALEFLTSLQGLGAAPLRPLIERLDDFYPVDWAQGSYISGDTGALAIKLKHLFKIEEEFSLINSNGDSDFVYLIHRTGDDSLYATAKQRLERIICPGVDHVFMLNSDKGSRYDNSLPRDPIYYDHIRGNPKSSLSRT